jgi:hypothetical protein
MNGSALSAKACARVTISGAKNCTSKARPNKIDPSAERRMMAEMPEPCQATGIDEASQPERFVDSVAVGSRYDLTGMSPG